MSRMRNVNAQYLAELLDDNSKSLRFRNPILKLAENNYFIRIK